MLAIRRRLLVDGKGAGGFVNVEVNVNENCGRRKVD